MKNIELEAFYTRSHLLEVLFLKKPLVLFCFLFCFESMALDFS